MKKALIACLAVVALFAIANTATAVTCTIDQRPAATLLIPYFQVSYDASGALVSTGIGARDTLVTIGNASSAPMVAHVNIFSRESTLLLDFNIALTGFDIQALRVSDILAGNLPNSADSPAVGQDVCQRQSSDPTNVAVYPSGGGFIRVYPLSPADPNDNTLATTAYPPFPQISEGLIHDLRVNCDGNEDALAVGYIVIDHANYCNLSNPTLSAYYANDAIGMENNLFGEIIFTSGLGLPTYGMSTVNLEADGTFGTLAAGNPGVPVRTFYARYWNPFTETNCTNCGSGVQQTDLSFPGNASWDEGFGDQREPLGLKWAARWFDLSPTITSFFRVWRSSPVGGDCLDPEPTVSLTFYDEDENIVTQGVCPSPCTQPTFNFPLETQQKNISSFSHPAGAAGWVDMSFVNSSSGDPLDQAWVDYSFEGAIALESILIPGTQLDPSSCNPLGVSGVQTVIPVISTIPTGTGR